jgi:hypothetical protein
MDRVVAVCLGPAVVGSSIQSNTKASSSSFGLSSPGAGEDFLTVSLQIKEEVPSLRRLTGLNRIQNKLGEVSYIGTPIFRDERRMFLTQIARHVKTLFSLFHQNASFFSSQPSFQYISAFAALQILHTHDRSYSLYLLL